MVAKIEHKNRTGCPIACSLDIIGDHWTLLIIRNLMFSERHEYKDMLKAEEQISSSILTTRLSKLEKDGLIASVPHPDSQRRKLYYLTPMGKDLIYVMTDIVLWAKKHLHDFLDIPADKQALLDNDPKKFIDITLENLDHWEKHNLS
ncbi:winged helix-turn-helix transcriptional regulator [Aliikangiella coralliicola]|uniref:Helix-turn-helix transcriptional regulator n=1 Tax=Aliikangiella coralliicola TaxID=2592383 RepID=A0A545UG62_9GAMM|nr:helix-turn-helix domain-containing protein [Aliikangiella coralliicola]TQV88460.1 helix-turn-helix transcriptional regulator [Aliikangiella coralliicola]